MNKYKQNIYELETLGFTIIKDVIKLDILQELKSKIDQALKVDNERFSKFKGKKEELIIDLTIHDKYFLSSIDNDIIFEFCNEILGNNPILYSYTSTILKPKVESKVQEIHIDSNKFIKDYITGLVMTIPLDDFTDENGATLYLPGSQNLEIKPSEETFNKNCVSTSRNAGDILFFNPRVWHKAGNNRTDKIRYGLTLYATRSFFKQRFDFPYMIPKENLIGLSDRILSFLGYNSCPPQSIDQYYNNQRI